VVILNVDHLRSDALVLIGDESKDKHASVVNIPLTGFSYKNGQKLNAELNNILKSAGVRDRGEARKGGLFFSGDTDTTFRDILRILWLDVVQPVISALKYQVCHCNHG